MVRERCSGTNSTSMAELLEHSAIGAVHDSEERCDEPQCHPGTRVAVQKGLVDWGEHGHKEKDPKGNQ